MRHIFAFLCVLLVFWFASSSQSGADDFNNRIRAVEEERSALIEQERSLLDQSDTLEKKEAEIKTQMTLLDRELSATHVKLVQTRHALITLQMKLH